MMDGDMKDETRRKGLERRGREGGKEGEQQNKKTGRRRRQQYFVTYIVPARTPTTGTMT